MSQVIVGDQSHVYQYEAGGMSVLGGVAFNVVPTLPNGELSLEALSAAVRQAFYITLHLTGCAALRDNELGKELH